MLCVDEKVPAVQVGKDGRIINPPEWLLTDRLHGAIKMLDAALYHARRGWAVFPLAPGTKFPFSGSHGYLDATRDEAEIRQMWSRCPRANIGGAPRKSGRLVVDIDRRRRGDATLAQWTEEYGPGFQLTITTLTPGGQHLTYLADEHVYENSKDKIGEGVEIKSSWGYVVLPPSLLRSGGSYIYEDYCSPLDIDERTVPGWLAAQLRLYEPGCVEATQVVAPRSGLADTVASLLSGAKLQGDELANLSGDEEFVLAACSLMNIQMRKLGSSFLCVLPGHDECRASASIFRNKLGRYVYHDLHKRDEHTIYTLAEVRRALAAGWIEPISRSEIALWQLRLLVETGYAPPATVDMPTLADDAPDYVRTVFEGFRHLLECRWLHTPGQATTFTRRFASVWCGVSTWHAGLAINWLIEAGLLILTGPNYYPRLFLPAQSP